MDNKAISSDNENVRFQWGYNFNILSGYITKREEQSNYKYQQDSISYEYYQEVSPQLQLSLTNICNFSCEYCSFRQRSIDEGTPAYMSMDIAKTAIKHFYDIYGTKAKYARIDYGLSGEPLIMQIKHNELNQFVADVFQTTTIQEMQVGTRTTNGTLLKKNGWEKMIGYPMDISCDGPEAVTDNVRKYNNGKGTYKNVRAVIDKALAHDPRISVSTVLTADYTNILDIYLHLKDELGFGSIYMKPVNLKHTDKKSLNKDTLESFKQGYTELANYILKQSPAKMLECLLTFDSQDFFMRYFYRTLHRSIQLYRCGAGISGMYVDTDGKLYPCAHFIGKTEYSIGDIENGVNPIAREKHLNLRVDKINGCSNCWVRYLCGGGCHYQAVLANNQIDKPDEVKCDLIRHLCSEAIRMICYFKENCPNVLTALPAPYFIPESDLGIDPNKTYTPTCKIFPAEENYQIDLSTKDRVEAGYFENDYAITVKLYFANNQLSILIHSDLEIKSVDINLITQDNLSKYLYSDLLQQANFPSMLTFNAVAGKKYIEQIIEKREGPMRIIPYHKPKINIIEESECYIGSNESKLSIPIEASYLSNDDQDKKLGFNMKINLHSGGFIQLVRHEPFAILNISGSEGWLKPFGGEFDEAKTISSANNIVNPFVLPGYEPINRMSKVKANVC